MGEKQQQRRSNNNDLRIYVLKKTHYKMETERQQKKLAERILAMVQHFTSNNYEVIGEIIDQSEDNYQQEVKHQRGQKRKLELIQSPPKRFKPSS